MEPDRVIGLFKIGKRGHIDEFLRGSLYMNTLEYFVRVEKDAARHDPREGQSVWMQADKVTLSLSVDGKMTPIPGLMGPLAFTGPGSLDVNVFCMYGLRAKPTRNVIDPRNFEFGDTFAAIKDGNEFFGRALKAARRFNQQLEWHTVEYLDEHRHHGEVGIYRKSSKFSYQSEVRIAVMPGTGSPYRLEIGNITDIAVAGSVLDLNAMVEAALAEQ